MSEDINEFYLFHGTSSEMAEVICKHGFDERMAQLTGLYGDGSYFAINLQEPPVFLSEREHFKLCDARLSLCNGITLLHFHVTHKFERRPPDNGTTPGKPFDSIFAQHAIGRAGQQHHNEYVVFDLNQVYPEYIVRYTA